MEKIWPMGCKKTPTEDKVNELLADPKFIAQMKIDGVRGILQFDVDGTPHLTTRGASVDDPETPIEITHRLPQLQRKYPRLAGTILDGEIWCPGYTSAEISGMVSYKSTVPVDHHIKLHVFDVLAINNNMTTGYMLKKRLPLLYNLYNEILCTHRGIEIVPFEVTEEDKRNLLYKELEEGREGIVLKNLNSTYRLGKPGREAKPVNHWYKVKKKDTVDVTITGSELPEKYYKDPQTATLDLNRLTKPYQMGWFGSITFMFKDEDGIMRYGSCSGITDNMKDKLSNGEHHIKDEYVGMIMEVEYMEKTSDGNLRHPRFVRIREREEK